MTTFTWTSIVCVFGLALVVALSDAAWAAMGSILYGLALVLAAVPAIIAAARAGAAKTSADFAAKRSSDAVDIARVTMQKTDEQSKKIDNVGVATATAVKNTDGTLSTMREQLAEMNAANSAMLDSHFDKLVQLLADRIHPTSPISVVPIVVPGVGIPPAVSETPEGGRRTGDTKKTSS